MLDERRNGDFSTPGRSSPIVLQHFRYAVSAAEHGSFRRAAEALLLRQSTFSRCVRQLEESTGLIVFERFSGGVRPTQAGQEFLRNARSILEQVDALAATAHSTGRGEAERLAIGFYTSLSAGNLRATLTDVAQRFPQLEIELIESSRKRLATALRNGGVDIAMVLALRLYRRAGSWRCGANGYGSPFPKAIRLPKDRLSTGSTLRTRRSC